MVQRRHRDGHHLLLHQQVAAYTAHHLLGSHLYDVRCLLPAGFPFPLHADSSEQIRLAY